VLLIKVILLTPDIDLQGCMHVQVEPATSTNQELLTDPARLALLTAYNKARPRVHFLLDWNPSPHTVPLHDPAVFYRYAILDGRRITPISQSKRDSAGSSLVKVNWDGEAWYGEVVRIFHHPKPGLSDPATERLLAEFRWMKEVPLSPVADNIHSICHRASP
jgi:hypothetical protein